MRQTFKSRENRDKAFREAGGKAAGYKKTSLRNQIINPKYVADSGVTGPTQFGDDTEMFSVLYSFVKVLPAEQPAPAVPQPKPEPTEAYGIRLVR